MRSTQVQNAGQLATVEALRYEVHRREQRRFPVSTDHARGLIRDPVDQDSHIWLAWDGDQAIGTIRATWGAECDLARLHPEYSLGPFIEAVGPARVVVASRFLVLPEYESGLASPLLMKEVADFTLGRGVDVAFTDCELHRVPHYESLGFRPHRAAFDDPMFGERVPMVLLFSDRDHLVDVDSPIRHRLPGSIPSQPDPVVLKLLESASVPCAGVSARASAPSS